MQQAILTINAGSSSIKFSIFRAESMRRMCHGQVESITSTPHLKIYDSNDKIIHERFFETLDESSHSAKTPDAVARFETRHYNICIEAIAEWISHNDNEISLSAICHRIVHGGRIFDQPVKINSFVMSELESLIPLAPLHQPHNLEAIRVFQRRYALVPQIGFFDTAFHASQPEIARRFALPRSLWLDGIERYGFHGISYSYIAHVLPEYTKGREDGRVIVAHLGNGASMCAMHKCQSVATTMGFTALDGLMMGSRSGNIDPGVVLYLIQEKNMEPDAVARLLYYQSGLKGVSGISSDMRELLKSDDENAIEAVELFVYQAARYFGALAAESNGVDALVFTAGIGENSPEIRQMICEKLAWFGIEIDLEANQRNQPRISTEKSKIAVYVIPTNEELMMAIEGSNIILG